MTLTGANEDATGIQITKASLLQGASDADADTLDVTGLTVDHGSVTIQGDHWIYTPEPNYNGDVEFSYTVDDGHGGSVAQTATMQLAAVNDKPVVTEVSQGTVRENSISGKTAAELSVTDVDRPSEEGFQVANGLHGTYGTLDIDEHGHWGYTLTDKQNPAVQALNVGDTLVDTVTVHTKDGTEYEVHVTITGDNDAPTVSGNVPLGHITQDSPVTLVKAALLASVTDPDNTDAEITISQLTAQHATVLIIMMALGLLPQRKALLVTSNLAITLMMVMEATQRQRHRCMLIPYCLNLRHRHHLQFLQTNQCRMFRLKQ